MKPWRHGASRTVFESSHLRVREDAITTHGGKDIRYVYVDHPGYALVVPRIDDGRYMLLRHYRPPVRGFVYEFPSGRIDPGEDPTQAAARELLEESGMWARSLKAIGRYYTTPGSSNEVAHLFLARAEPIQSPKHGPDEQMSMHFLREEEIAQLLESGEIGDAVSALAFALARGLKAD